MTWDVARKPTVLGLMMVIAAGLTIAATPARRMADEGTKINLETMIPESFGDWRIDRSIVPVSVSPDVQAKLDKIYNQTLARSYINNNRQRVMLSIAYGGDQSDAMRAHRPEVCYAAQGFEVSRLTMSLLALAETRLPVVKMVARHGQRNEPIVYWMTVGDIVVQSGLQQKLAQIRYGLSGTVPDGLLVRVSSIGVAPNEQYAIQEEFVSAMIRSTGPEHRRRLIGELAGKSRPAEQP